MDNVTFKTLDECVRFRYDRFLRGRLVSGFIDVTDLSINIVAFTMNMDRDLTQYTDDELTKWMQDEDIKIIYSNSLNAWGEIYTEIQDSIELFEAGNDITLTYDGMVYVLPFNEFWKACDDFITKYLILKGKFEYVNSICE